jgi:ABC-2 type transport system ATP-binding protein
VSLAKALINRPEILLLDEPTAALDPDTADWVRAMLQRYRAERGVTILLPPTICTRWSDCASASS